MTPVVSAFPLVTDNSEARLIHLEAHWTDDSKVDTNALHINADDAHLWLITLRAWAVRRLWLGKDPSCHPNLRCREHTTGSHIGARNHYKDQNCLHKQFHDVFNLLALPFITQQSWQLTAAIGLIAVPQQAPAPRACLATGAVVFANPANGDHPAEVGPINDLSIKIAAALGLQAYANDHFQGYCAALEEHPDLWPADHPYPWGNATDRVRPGQVQVVFAPTPSIEQCSGNNDLQEHEQDANSHLHWVRCSEDLPLRKAYDAAVHGDNVGWKLWHAYLNQRHDVQKGEMLVIGVDRLDQCLACLGYHFPVDSDHKPLPDPPVWKVRAA